MTETFNWIKDPKNGNDRQKRYNSRRVGKLIIFLIIIALFVGALVYNNFQISGPGLIQFFENIAAMTGFKNESAQTSNILFTTIEYFLISLVYSIAGTVLGFYTALVSVYFTSANLQIRVVYKITKYIMRFFMSIPWIFIAFIYIKQMSAFLGTLMTVWWISWIYLHRTIRPEIEKVNFVGHLGSYVQNRFQFVAYIYYVTSQSPKIINIVLNRIESLIRFTSFIPAFGGLHAASLVSPYVTGDQTDYAYVGIPLFVAWIIYLILEVVIFRFVNYFVYDEQKPHDFQSIGKAILKVRYTKLALAIFSTLFALGTIIYAVAVTTSEEKAMYSLTLSNVINPDWSLLTSSYLFSSLWSTFSMFVAALVFAYIFGIIFGLGYSKLISKSWVSNIIKVILYWFRILPGVVLFWLMRTAFINEVSAAIFAIAVVQSNNLIIYTRNAIDGFSERVKMQIISRLRTFGWIYTVWTVVIPHLKSPIANFLAFHSYEIWQQLAIFGLFNATATGRIYYQANTKTESELLEVARQTLPAMVPFITFAFALLSVEYVSYLWYNYSKRLFPKDWHAFFHRAYWINVNY